MKDFGPKNTRDLILDATDKLLSRSGYKKMTIDDLAREVGIGKGSVYLHFASKEEIVISHIDRIIERVKKKLTEVAASDAPCEERVREMLVQRVLMRFDSVQHYSKSLDELLSKIRPQLLERRKRYFQEESRILARVIAEGISEDVFDAGDPDENAAILLTATNSLLPYSLTTKQLGARAEIEKQAYSLAGMLLHGLMRPRSRSTK